MKFKLLMALTRSAGDVMRVYMSVGKISSADEDDWWSFVKRSTMLWWADARFCNFSNGHREMFI